MKPIVIEGWVYEGWEKDNTFDGKKDRIYRIPIDTTGNAWYKIGLKPVKVKVTIT